MKKFLRNLFSGYFLVLLILLIELAIFVYVQFFLDDTVAAILTDSKVGTEDLRLILSLIYLLLRFIVFIISVIIFFRIVNKPEDPEFKIPWIIGMLLMPLFTSIIFIIFGNHGLRKKDRIIIRGSKNAYNAHFRLTEDKKEEYTDIQSL